MAADDLLLLTTLALISATVGAVRGRRRRHRQYVRLRLAPEEMTTLYGPPMPSMRWQWRSNEICCCPP